MEYTAKQDWLLILQYEDLYVFNEPDCLLELAIMELHRFVVDKKDCADTHTEGVWYLTRLDI